MRILLASTLLLAVAGWATPDAAAQSGRYNESFVRCDSTDGRLRQCPMDTRGGVRLVRQRSKTACIEGQSWGVDRNGVWVAQGCRADFSPGYDGGYSGDYGDRVLRCESRDSRSRHCPADTRGGVELTRQLSRSACVRGQSWDWDDSGVWVSGGCRGEFRMLSGHDAIGPDRRAQIVRCESKNGRPRLCPVDTRGGVRLVRQLSRTPCTEGHSWGRDRDGIWVERGCRADFEVGYRRDGGWRW